jgi:hypothetical protein
MANSEILYLEWFGDNPLTRQLLSQFKHRRAMFSYNTAVNG